MAACTNLTMEDFCNLSNSSGNRNENEIITVTPGHLKFPYDNVLAHVVPVVVWNKSKNLVRFRVSLPQTDIFEIYCDQHSIFSNSEATLYIKCKPRDTQICIDCFEIQILGHPGIRVLLELLPGVDWFVLPKFISMPIAALNQRVEVKVDLPVPRGKRTYDFCIVSPITQIFSVTPRCGFIGGSNGVQYLTVTFRSHEYLTLTYKLLIKFPGIESPPYEVNVYGRCVPNAQNDVLRQDVFQIEKLTADLQNSDSKALLKHKQHKRLRLKSQVTSSSSRKSLPATTGGVSDPLAGGDTGRGTPNLFTPAGIMKFLLKKDSDSEVLGPLGVSMPVMTAAYNEKKREFEKELSRYKIKQANLAVHHHLEKIGEDAIDDQPETMEKIFNDREKAVMEYHKALGLEPNESEDLTRIHLKKVNQRQIRNAGPIPKPRFAPPAFDEDKFRREKKFVKTQILRPFVQAARVIITRWRVDQRLKKLKILVRDFDKIMQEERSTQQAQDEIKGEDDGDNEMHVILPIEKRVSRLGQVDRRKIPSISKYQCFAPRTEYPTKRDKVNAQLEAESEAKRMKTNLELISNHLKVLRGRVQSHLENAKRSFERKAEEEEEEEEEDEMEVDDELISAHVKQAADLAHRANVNLFLNPENIIGLFEMGIDKEDLHYYGLIPESPNPVVQSIMDEVNRSLDRLQEKLQNKKIAKEQRELNNIFGTDPPASVRLYGGDKYTTGQETEESVRMTKNICILPTQNRMLPAGVTLYDVEIHVGLIQEAINNLQEIIQNLPISRIHQEINREMDKITGQPLIGGFLTQTYKPLEIDVCSKFKTGPGENNLLVRPGPRPRAPLPKEDLKKYQNKINHCINELQGKINSRPLDFLQDQLNKEIRKLWGFATPSDISMILYEQKKRKEYAKKHFGPSYQSNFYGRIFEDATPEEIRHLLQNVNEKMDLLQSIELRQDVNNHHRNINRIVNEILQIVEAHIFKHAEKPENAYKTDYDALEELSRMKAGKIANEKLLEQKKKINDSLRKLAGMLAPNVIGRVAKKLNQQINALLGISESDASGNLGADSSSFWDQTGLSSSNETFTPMNLNALRKRHDILNAEMLRLYAKYGDERINGLCKKVHERFAKVFDTVMKNTLAIASMVSGETPSISYNQIPLDLLNNLQQELLNDIAILKLEISDSEILEDLKNLEDVVEQVLAEDQGFSEGESSKPLRTFVDKAEVWKFKEEMENELNTIFDNYQDPRVKQIEDKYKLKLEKLLENPTIVTTEQMNELREQMLQELGELVESSSNPELAKELSEFINKTRNLSITGVPLSVILEAQHASQTRIQGQARKKLEQFNQEVAYEFNELREKYDDPIISQLEESLHQEIRAVLDHLAGVTPESLQKLRDDFRDRITEVAKKTLNEGLRADLLKIRDRLADNISSYSRHNADQSNSKGSLIQAADPELVKKYNDDLTTQLNTLANTYTDPRIKELQNRIAAEMQHMVDSGEPITEEDLERFRDHFREELANLIDDSSNPDLITDLTRLKDKPMPQFRKDPYGYSSTILSAADRHDDMIRGQQNRRRLESFQVDFNREVDDLYDKYDDEVLLDVKNAVNKSINKRLASFSKPITLDNLFQIRDKAREEILRGIANTSKEDVRAALGDMNNMMDQKLIYDGRDGIQSQTGRDGQSRGRPMETSQLKVFQDELTEELTALYAKYDDPIFLKILAEVDMEIKKILEESDETVSALLVHNLRDRVRDRLQQVIRTTSNQDLIADISKLLDKVDDELFTRPSDYAIRVATGKMIEDQLVNVNKMINDLQGIVMSPSIANTTKQINNIVRKLFRDKVRDLQERLRVVNRMRKMKEYKDQEARSRKSDGSGTGSSDSLAEKTQSLKRHRQRIDSAISHLNEGIDDEDITEQQSLIYDRINQMIQINEKIHEFKHPKITVDPSEIIIKPEDIDSLMERVNSQMSTLNHQSELKVAEQVGKVDTTIKNFETNLLKNMESNVNDPGELKGQVSKFRNSLSQGLDHLLAITNDPRVSQFTNQSLLAVDNLLSSDVSLDIEKVKTVQGKIEDDFTDIMKVIPRPKVSLDIQHIGKELLEFFGSPGLGSGKRGGKDRNRAHSTKSAVSSTSSGSGGKPKASQKQVTKQQLQNYLNDMNKKFSTLINQTEDAGIFQDARKHINDEINNILKSGSYAETKESKLPHEALTRLREMVNGAINNIQQNIANNEITAGIYNLKKIINNQFGTGSGIKLPNRNQLKEHLSKINKELNKFMGLDGKVSDGIILQNQQVINDEFKRALGAFTDATTKIVQKSIAIPPEKFEHLKKLIKNEMINITTNSTSPRVQEKARRLSETVEGLFKRHIHEGFGFDPDPESTGGQQQQNLGRIKEILENEFDKLRAKYEDLSINDTKKKVLDEIQKVIVGRSGQPGTSDLTSMTPEKIKQLVSKIHQSMKLLKEKVQPSENLQEKLNHIQELDKKIDAIFGIDVTDTDDTPNKAELLKYQEMVNAHFDKLLEETGGDEQVVNSKKRINDEINKILYKASGDVAGQGQGQGRGRGHGDGQDRERSKSIGDGTHTKEIQKNMKRLEESVRHEMKELEQKIAKTKPQLQGEFSNFHDTLLKMFLSSKMEGYGDMEALTEFHDQIQKEYTRQFDTHGFKDIKVALNKINKEMNKFNTFFVKMKEKTQDIQAAHLKSQQKLKKKQVPGGKKGQPVHSKLRILPPNLTPEAVQANLNIVNDEIQQLQKKIRDEDIERSKQIINESIASLISLTLAASTSKAMKRKSRFFGERKRSESESSPATGTDTTGTGKGAVSKGEGSSRKKKIVSHGVLEEQQKGIDNKLDKLKGLLKHHPHSKKIGKQQKIIVQTIGELMGKKSVVEEQDDLGALHSATSVWKRPSFVDQDLDRDYVQPHDVDYGSNIGRSERGDSEYSAFFTTKEIEKLRDDINEDINGLLEVSSNTRVKKAQDEINAVVDDVVKTLEKEQMETETKAQKAAEIEHEIKKMLGMAIDETSETNFTLPTDTSSLGSYDTSLNELLDLDLEPDHDQSRDLAQDSRNSKRKSKWKGKGKKKLKKLTQEEEAVRVARDKETVEQYQDNINEKFDEFLKQVPTVDVIKNQIQLNQILDDLKGLDPNDEKHFKAKPLFMADRSQLKNLGPEELLLHKTDIQDELEKLKENIPIASLANISGAKNEEEKKQMTEQLEQRIREQIGEVQKNFDQGMDKLITKAIGSAPEGTTTDFLRSKQGLGQESSTSASGNRKKSLGQGQGQDQDQDQDGDKGQGHGAYEFVQDSNNEPHNPQRKMLLPSDVLKKPLGTFNEQLENILDTKAVRQNPNLSAQIVAAHDQINDRFNDVLNTETNKDGQGQIPITREELSQFVRDVNDNFDKASALADPQLKTEKLKENRKLFNTEMNNILEEFNAPAESTSAVDHGQGKVDPSKDEKAQRLSTSFFHPGTPQFMTVAQLQRINKVVKTVQQKTGNKEIGPLALQLNEHLREALHLPPPVPDQFILIDESDISISTSRPGRPTGSSQKDQDKDKDKEKETPTTAITSPAEFQTYRENINEFFDKIPDELKTKVIHGDKENIISLLIEMENAAKDEFITGAVKTINTVMDELQAVDTGMKTIPRKSKHDESDMAKLQRLLNNNLREQLGLPIESSKVKDKKAAEFLTKFLRGDGHPDDQDFTGVKDEKLLETQAQLEKLVDVISKLPEDMKTDEVRQIEQAIRLKLKNIEMQKELRRAAAQLQKINKEVYALQSKLDDTDLARLAANLNETFSKLLPPPVETPTGEGDKNAEQNRDFLGKGGESNFTLSSATGFNSSLHQGTGRSMSTIATVTASKITLQEFRKRRKKVVKEISNFPQLLISQSEDAQRAKKSLLDFLGTLENAFVTAYSKSPEGQILNEINKLQDKVAIEFKGLEMKILGEVMEMEKTHQKPSQTAYKMYQFKRTIRDQIVKFQDRINYETRKLAKKVRHLKNLKHKAKHLKMLDDVEDGIAAEIQWLVELINDMMDPDTRKAKSEYLKAKLEADAKNEDRLKFWNDIISKRNAARADGRGNIKLVNGKPRFFISLPGLRSMTQFPTTRGKFLVKESESALLNPNQIQSRWADMLAKPSFYGIRLPHAESRLIEPKLTESVLMKHTNVKETMQDKLDEFTLSKNSAEALLEQLMIEQQKEKQN